MAAPGKLELLRAAPRRRQSGATVSFAVALLVIAFCRAMNGAVLAPLGPSASTCRRPSP